MAAATSVTARLAEPVSGDFYESRLDLSSRHAPPNGASWHSMPEVEAARLMRIRGAPERYYRKLSIGGRETGGASFHVNQEHNLARRPGGGKHHPWRRYSTPHGNNLETAEDDVPTLDAVARDAARRMLHAALDEEVARYIEAHGEAWGEDGRRRVVRKGRAQARTVTCGAGTIRARAPRVNDRRDDDEDEQETYSPGLTTRRRGPSQPRFQVLAVLREQLKVPGRLHASDGTRIR